MKVNCFLLKLKVAPKGFYIMHNDIGYTFQTNLLKETQDICVYVSFFSHVTPYLFLIIN